MSRFFVMTNLDGVRTPTHDDLCTYKERFARRSTRFCSLITPALEFPTVTMEAASVTQHTGGDIAKNRAREVRSLMSLPNEVLDQIVEFSGTPLTELESLDERSYSGLKNLALVNRFFREMCQRRHLRHIRLSVFQEKLGTKLEEIMREHPESVRNAKCVSCWMVELSCSMMTVPTGLCLFVFSGVIPMALRHLLSGVLTTVL